MFVYIFSISLQLTWMEWWLMLRAVCWDFCCQWESGGSETMGWEAWDGLQYGSMCFCREILKQHRKDTVSEACWGGGGVAMGILRRQSTATRLPQAKSPWATPGQPFPLFRKRKTLQLEHQTEAKSLCANRQEKKAKAPTWRKPQVSPVVNWREKEVQLCHVCVTTAWICTLIGRILFFFQC